MVIVMAANGTMVGEDIVINEGVKTPIAVLGIVTAVIALLLELVFYILYLRALSKGKKMLAN